MKRMLFITVALLLSPAAAVMAQESYDLKYEYNVDKPLQYELKIAKAEEQKFPGYAGIPVTIEMYIDFTQEKSITEEDSLLNIRMTFDKSEIFTRLPGRTMEPRTELLNAKAITARIESKGKVVETIGMEFIPNVMTKPGDMVGENLAEYLKQFFLQLPEEPVKVGDLWQISRKDTTEQQGMIIIAGITADMQFKKIVKKFGFDCAQLVGKIKLDVSQNGEAMGNKIDFKGDGRGKIDAYFALKEGILAGYKVSQDIDGLFNVSGSQNLEGTFSQQMETEFKIKK